MPPGAPPFIVYGAGLIELVGGVLVLLGLFAAPAAFISSGTMAVAYFMMHASGGLLPIVNKGEMAVLYCFIFLYLVFAGPGSPSFDHRARRRGPARRRG